MWTLEIENVKSEVQKYTFETYNKADEFLMGYMSSRGMVDCHIGRMYATEYYTEATTGDLIEESGEIFYDDTHCFHANYTITRG